MLSFRLRKTEEKGIRTNNNIRPRSGYAESQGSSKLKTADVLAKKSFAM